MFNADDAKRIKRREITNTVAPEINHPELREYVFKMHSQLTDKIEKTEKGEGLVDDVWLDGVTVVDNRIAKLTKEKIKQSYESNPDTNCFTDADKTMLNDHEERVVVLEHVTIKDVLQDGVSVVTDRVANITSTGKVDDVKVDGTSVVVDKVANIDIDSRVTEVKNYTDVQIQNAISSITGIEFVVVDALPDTGDANKVYCLRNASGYLEQYIYYNGAWEQLSSSVVLDEITVAQVDTWWGMY